MFWIGYITEQVLVVNVRGFGLVLISGCGHPRIEQILGVTERVLDVPIRAVVGGLHVPVHPAGTPLVPQAILGSPHPPWRPISAPARSPVRSSAHGDPRMVKSAGGATRHQEPHADGMAARLNWLRAAVLGANDGVVSTAGLVVGVARGHVSGDGIPQDVLNALFG